MAISKQTGISFVCVCMCAHWLSRVQLFVIPRMVAGQAPLCVEFSRQQYGVGSHSLLQGIFPDPGMEHVSPGLAGRFFTAGPAGQARISFETTSNCQ